MSRRADRALRPSVDGLEGRLLLSAGVQRQVTHGPRVTETVYFESPWIVSQQSTTATVTLHRQAIPTFDSRSNRMSPGRLDGTLVVRVNSLDPAAYTTQSGPPTFRGSRTGYYDPTVSGPLPGIPLVVPSNGPGQAIPNVHFVPVDETVTFLPGETTKTITIGIIPGAENPGRLAVQLQASSITGAPVGALTSFTIDSRAGAMMPMVVNSQLVVAGKKATGIAIQFNTPMDVATVTNPKAYKVTDLSHEYSKGDILKYMLFQKFEDYSKPVKIRSATWDASTNTVTLIPQGPLMASGRYQVDSRRLPRTKAAGFQRMTGDRLAVPLRDQIGNFLNDTGTGSLAGGFSASATRNPSSIHA